LAEDGMISVTVLLSQHEGRLLGKPELVARGVLHEDVSADVLAEAAVALQQFLEQMDKELLADLDAAKEEVRLFLRRWCRKKIGRRPMVLPVILAV
jgi:ribonuclease J